MEIVPYSLNPIPFQFNTPAEECKYWGINSHLNFDPVKTPLLFFTKASWKLSLLFILILLTFAI